MNLTLILIIVILVLVLLLIAVTNAAAKANKKAKDLEGVLELKNKTINYLYQNAKDVAQINADKDKKQEELSNAESEEEVADIVRAVATANNDRVRNKNKTK